ncbi:MAG: hypothetical protein J6W64_08265 [Bacilli bacterium]|nr:hypothetical protein [Bacilli bacterium]
MDNETKIKLQFNNSVNGAKKIEEYSKNLEKLYGLVSALNKGQVAQLESSVGEINKQVKATTKETDNISKKFSNLFSIAKITAFTKGVKSLFSSLTSATKKSSEYIENVNLLEVAYKNANETIEESSARIETFIDKMSEVYGLDESRLTRQFGIFKQLANAMQLPAEEGERLSEIMVKMTNDVASLYNLDLERASNALQSALVGQTRPIRGATGADITEKTLQTTVDALGLDRQISQLSFVEKRLVMVISLTNQLKVSQGDYARTIESASNQIRIMKEQWDRLSRAVGNVFYPILQKILPYLNGILMALTEIFNLIAALFGFEMPEFDYSSLSSTSDAALDLMDNLDGAGKSVDKLAAKMKGLRNFDKLNVINTPSSSGGASVSGGGVGAIDPKIMGAFNKAFEDYNDLMGKVRMKALDIRDAIMEWLGFTKKINPLTGEIEWEYGGIGKTLSNMWNSFNKLNPLVKAFVGFNLLKLFTNLITSVGKFTGLIGTNGLIKNVDGLNKIFDKTQKILFGATGLIVGFNLVTDGIYKLKTNTDPTIGTLEALGGALSSIAGGALIGAQFGGGWGALIGGIVGLTSSLVAALEGLGKKYDYVTEEVKKNQQELDDYTESLKKQYEAIDESTTIELTKLGSHEKLINMLEEITDANGKVKQGYEERATFIVTELNKAYGTEMKIQDGVVQGMQKEIDKIKETIELQKAKILQNLAEEKYKIAIQEEAAAWEHLNHTKALQETAQANLNREQERYNEILNEETKKWYNKQLALEAQQEKVDKAKKNLDELNQQVNETKTNVDLNQQAIANYTGITNAIIEGDAKAIEEFGEKIKNNYAGITQAGEDSYIQLGRKGYEYWESRLRTAGKKYEELNEQEQAFVNESIDLFVNQFKKEVEKTNEMTPEMVAAWYEMATKSEDAFFVALKKLPDEVQQNVIDNLNQRGLKIDIKTSLIQPTNAEIQNYVNKLGNKASSALGVNILKLNASGGIFANGKWQDIAQYAGGTVNAPVGQMFVARERGPELVGTIGGHTAVMNNDQIVSSVASGVYQAVKSATSQQTSSQPQVFNIYLDKNNKVATYVLDKLDNMAKSNGKPIEIGG